MEPALESTLSDLLEAARRRPIGEDDASRQRRSFAFGNGNIDRESFSRVTMSVLIPPAPRHGETRAGSILASDPVVHQHDIEGAMRQVDVAMGLIEAHVGADAPHFRLSKQVILDLHRALHGDETARFRRADIHILESDHAPVPPGAIEDEVEAMCRSVNDAWEERDAIALAAFILWRLNWIHPFADGNGRTARALSFVVLNIKLGMRLPGAPTVPEQLLYRRAEYLDALAAADASALAGNPDLGELCGLLRDLLTRQLESRPALSDAELGEIETVIARRVSGATLTIPVFGDSTISHRAWSFDDLFILHLGPGRAIVEAEDRYEASGHPFPRLFAATRESAERIVSPGERGLIIRESALALERREALFFDHNSAAVIENPSVAWTEPTPGGWAATGALYAVRYGRLINSEWLAETLDLLLARHMAGLKR